MARYTDFHNVVIEFPDNSYVMTCNKSANSDYEMVTMASTYKQTTSYLFRWFRNMQSSCNSKNSHENISAMIEVFRTHKEELFMALRECVLIEGIVLTCFRMQIEESDLVCQVLLLMYECWSSFSPLNFTVILGRYQRLKGKIFEDLLSFFLEHATRNKLEFNGIRMVDVSMYSSFYKPPIFLAVNCWNWKEMLTYLQYGAKCEDLLQDPTKSYYGVVSALADIFRWLVRHLWFRLVSPVAFLTFHENKKDIYEYCSNLDPDVKNLCRTINILLRAIRRIQPGSIDYLIKHIDDELAIRFVPTCVVWQHPTVKIMIPKFAQRYEGPEELQHICRWIIRKRLNENWQLPHGIQSLPLPNRMKKYLNLLTDQ